jgi:predicted CXXCH cytochrome family protein
VVVAAVPLVLYARRADPPPPPPTYVGRESCAACHEAEDRAWRGSHHDRAMEVATAETVLGDFDDAQVAFHGVAWEFFRKEGRFFVRTEGADGEPTEREIKFTFGFDPLQQYLVEAERGRLQALTASWDTAGQRWFSLYDEELRPGDPLHWTGPMLNWNHMCSECHSTDLRRNYDPARDVYDTTWEEIDVSCEACHGPAGNHVAWAEELERSGGGYDAADTMGLVTHFEGPDNRLEVEMCARCHSRRTEVSGDYEFGDRFLDHHDLVLLQDVYYFADGQIDDEVYVYGSFLQSRMYQRGVRCTDCHDPHSMRLRAEGDAVCLRCHTEPPEDAPGASAGRYDSKEHHFHEPNTPGAFCVDCHMPARTYMVVDPRRDHRFHIPRPDLAEALGAPDPCIGCHEDKGAAWNIEAFSKWYPLAVAREPRFAAAFRAGRAREPEAEQALARISRDQTEAGIVRATALRLLSAYSSEGALLAVGRGTTDPDALVRAAAVEGLSSLVRRTSQRGLQARKAAWVAPLLTDPVRTVRVEAVRVLAEVPAALRKGFDRRDFDSAASEYVQRQRAVAERPEAYLNLGLFFENLGRSEEAERAYLQALERDPDFLPVRFNLANFYNTQSRNLEAEKHLRRILAVEPENGEAHYSLGLLLAELDQLKRAVRHLEQAAASLPGRARVRYNLALALQHAGRDDRAEAVLLEARGLAPGDPEIVHALAILYFQRQDWDRALAQARRLVELAPSAPGPRQLVARIEAERKRRG